MSSNLRNQKYYFRNQYVGKDEYEQKIREINFGDWNVLGELKKEFLEMKHAAPRRPSWNEKSVDSFGDYIKNSKNVYFGLWVEDSENVAYSEGLVGTRDSYDLLGGSNSEFCYELANVWAENLYGCKFSTQIDNCRDVEFCDLCRNCQNCFGCVGLDNKEFCIFNKQYSEEGYWKAVDEIKTNMLKAREYGEFFPPQYLTMPYRAATVGYYYGFEDFDNAKKYGYDTTPLGELEDSNVVLGETLPAANIPADIRDVRDDIVSKIIIDSDGKRYRILKQELDFYRTHSVPIPREHPATRMSKWRKQFGLVVSFYKRNCAKCGGEITTTFSPNASEKNIWCESCYLEELG